MISWLWRWFGDSGGEQPAPKCVTVRLHDMRVAVPSDRHVSLAGERALTMIERTLAPHPERSVMIC
jgi:hypothetical protein